MVTYQALRPDPHRKRVQTDDQGLIHAEINIDLSVHDDDIDALGGRP